MIFIPNITSARKKCEYNPMIDVVNGINDIEANKKYSTTNKGYLKILP